MDYTLLNYDWENAPITEFEESNFITPDDGDYVVALVSVSMENRTNQDKTQTYPSIIWTFAIKGGDHEGKQFRKFSDLKSKNAMSFFKGEIKKILPAIPKNIETIVPTLQTVLNKSLNVTVKTYGETANKKPLKSVYINGYNEAEKSSFETLAQIKDAIQNGNIPKNEASSKSDRFYDDDIPF